MTEPGNDAMLPKSYDPADAVLADWAFSEQEERRVQAAGIAVMEPGDDFPDPDEVPPGDPPEYDPMPPEVPS